MWSWFLSLNAYQYFLIYAGTGFLVSHGFYIFGTSKDESTDGLGFIFAFFALLWPLVLFLSLCWCYVQLLNHVRNKRESIQKHICIRYKEWSKERQTRAETIRKERELKEEIRLEELKEKLQRAKERTRPIEL